MKGAIEVVWREPLRLQRSDNALVLAGGKNCTKTPHGRDDEAGAGHLAGVDRSLPEPRAVRQQGAPEL